ncbi:LOB domain-containing protein 20 [Senna tora]|uniref:LOB domain-containing protein 20 n=1 Tax=Senna tora TaxID=362788 RepID=A0A834SD99_9FABA|nr:LOB domain-containing protein 20 [Senna tora]
MMADHSQPPPPPPPPPPRRATKAAAPPPNKKRSSAAAAPPCGACKFLRRKCMSGCIFAPHFGSDQGAARFAAVHKVFGASNVSKLLLQIPANRRHDAVVTISYEAQARLSDPVYGCVSTILALQQQVYLFIYFLIYIYISKIFLLQFLCNYVACLQAEVNMIQSQRLHPFCVRACNHNDGSSSSSKSSNTIALTAGSS